ncbi:MAG: hypothetical protein Q9187_001497 [Circinaria calcarea]
MDTTTRVNNHQSSSTQYPSSTIPSSPGLPHHESLKPGGILQRPVNPSSPTITAENKRISALTDESHQNTNRNSQISTSTNASNKGRRKIYVGPWHLGKTLGKGSTGRVRSARHKLTGQVAAIKIVSKKSAQLVQSKSIAGMDRMLAQRPVRNGRRFMPFGIEREVVIMKLIEHPNIISLFDVWENRGELYLVLEYVEGGELFNYISENGRLSEQEAVRIHRQIISGLGHCHRFQICHRDLKPENILMDKNLNVKIVDFGMAALQPAGSWLETSCGSPHYACPEIASGRRYQGVQADIWSCGVVLYAMLVGTLPFGTGDERETVDSVLEEVQRGELRFPREVSNTARDLIWRILQRDPNQRISLEQMWQHPLLRGPPQPLRNEDCGPPLKDRASIEDEILGNLCTLFYQAGEKAIIEKLLSNQPNYEKVFYYSLLRFREEQLENYEGPQIELSASDYHHVQRPAVQRSATRLSLQGPGHLRRRSQFSIQSDNLRHTSQNSRRQPSVAETEQSYDPFRPSRRQIISAKADHAKITVLRGSSDASQGRRTPSNAASLRHPALVRVQGEEMPNIPSSPPPLPSSYNGRTPHSKEEHIGRIHSRSSLASSHRQRTSSAGIRKSMSYKRGVSFNHTRKRSSSDILPPQPSRVQRIPSPLTLQQRGRNDLVQQSSPNLPSPNALDSPQYEYSQAVRSRKDTPGLTQVQELASRKSKTASNYWKEEARKVSIELSKFCDEAFNRSSVASSVQTAVTTSPGSQKESPTTIASIQGVPPIPYRESAQMNGRSRLDTRPLPRRPAPHLIDSYTQRELAKTRDRLKERAADPEAGLPPGSLDGVISQLDRLMEPSSKVWQRELERRVVSAPDSQATEHMSLSPVKEEDNRDSWITADSSPRKSTAAYRTVSEPIRKLLSAQGRLRNDTDGRTTIRIVDDDPNRPLSPIRPLVIRKRSEASIPSDRTVQMKKSQEKLAGTKIYSEKPQLTFDDAVFGSSSKPAHRDDRRSSGLSLLDSTLDPIEGDNRKDDRESRAAKTLSGESKTKGWFRRHRPAQSSQESDRPPTPPMKDDWLLQGIDPKKDAKSKKRVSDVPSEESQRSETKKERTSAKEKFFKMFSKRDSRDFKGPGELMLGDNEPDEVLSITPSSNASNVYMSGALQDFANSPSTSRPKTRKNNRSYDPPILRSIQPAPQNWLARFLHIKPATKILCFQLSNVRARQEVVGILKDWRKYGMRDIAVDKARARVWASVASENHLKIRPVSLAIEFFTVLDRGRRTNLSIARFTQEKGAKSSFERVLGTLEGVLGGRDVLVVDRRRKREMESVLREFAG